MPIIQTPSSPAAPRRRMPPPPPPPQLSGKCAAGKHKACLGKMTVYPLRNRKRFVVCECPVCNHPAPRKGRKN